MYIALSIAGVATFRISRRQISPIKGGSPPPVSVLGRIRSLTPFLLPSSVTGRSHLGNLGSRTWLQARIRTLFGGGFRIGKR